MTSYHQAVVDAIKGVRSFFETNFTSITIDGPKLDAASLSNQPMMLVSTHRSHVDYFLLGYVFNKLGFKNLRFAAGDNLTGLPWIGPRFLKFGAFTVERDTGFDRHYVRKLCFNVVSMIEKGDVVIVFPEGGRSYSGAMLEMRSGILGASVISEARDLSRDVRYIPIAVSYECPPDVPWFSMQMKGKMWRKRSNVLPKRLLGNLLYFGADINAFLPLFLPRFLKRIHGAIYIDYGEPVSIRSIIDLAAHKAGNARDDFSAHRFSMQKLSEAVFEQLFRLYRVLPLHVVAAQLKEHGRRSITDCADCFPEVTADLKRKGRNVKQIERLTPLENAAEGIGQLRRLKAVTVKRNICSIRNESLINYFAATIV
ncbi:MAG: 1-acyl-sn-glycerol-3-phosphate acyltransferase [Chitinispirillaceae bacterium]|nr:1-acyl-sn-glycerol-3-phosphate acyltransferase [Chitinispirillaceae bacterium]